MNTRDLHNGQAAITVTLDDVVSLEDKIDAQERALAEDKKRLEAYYTLFGGAEAIKKARRERVQTPPPAIPQVVTPILLASDTPVMAPVHPALVFTPKDVTLQGGIVRTLAAAGRGMTHEELRDSMESLDDSIKARWEGYADRPFYKAVTNVLSRGLVVRHHGYLYAKEVYEAMEARGERFPVKETRALPRRGTGYAVQKLLEAEGRTLTATEIYERLSQKPSLPKSLSKHGRPYLDKILAEMVERRDVIKVGDRYSAPRKAKG